MKKFLLCLALMASPVFGQVQENLTKTAPGFRGTLQIINATDLGNIDGVPGNDYRIGGVFFGASNFGGTDPGDPTQYSILDFAALLGTDGRLVAWDPSGYRWEVDPTPAQALGAGETIAFTGLNINEHVNPPAIGRGVISYEVQIPCGDTTEWITLYVSEQGTDINASLQSAMETHNASIIAKCLVAAGAVNELITTTSILPGTIPLPGVGTSSDLDPTSSNIAYNVTTGQLFLWDIGGNIWFEVPGAPIRQELGITTLTDVTLINAAPANDPGGVVYPNMDITQPNEIYNVATGQRFLWDPIAADWLEFPAPVRQELGITTLTDVALINAAPANDPGGVVYPNMDIAEANEIYNVTTGQRFVWDPIAADWLEFVVKQENIVFVDDTYGDNLTGQYERRDRPFKDYVGASAAVVADGDTLEFAPNDWILGATADSTLNNLVYDFSQANVSGLFRSINNGGYVLKAARAFDIRIDAQENDNVATEILSPVVVTNHVALYNVEPGTSYHKSASVTVNPAAGTTNGVRINDGTDVGTFDNTFDIDGNLNVQGPVQLGTTGDHGVILLTGTITEDGIVNVDIEGDVKGNSRGIFQQGPVNSDLHVNIDVGGNFQSEAAFMRLNSSAVADYDVKIGGDVAVVQEPSLISLSTAQVGVPKTINLEIGGTTTNGGAASTEFAPLLSGQQVPAPPLVARFRDTVTATSGFCYWFGAKVDIVAHDIITGEDSRFGTVGATGATVSSIHFDRWTQNVALRGVIALGPGNHYLKGREISSSTLDSTGLLTGAQTVLEVSGSAAFPTRAIIDVDEIIDTGGGNGGAVYQNSADPVAVVHLTVKDALLKKDGGTGAAFRTKGGVTILESCRIIGLNGATAWQDDGNPVTVYCYDCYTNGDPAVQAPNITIVGNLTIDPLITE